MWFFRAKKMRQIPSNALVNTPAHKSSSARQMQTLSRLLIRAHSSGSSSALASPLQQLRSDLSYVAGLGMSDLTDFLELANTNHVIVRALTVLQELAHAEDEKRIADWCAHTIATERDRIHKSIAMLHRICSTMEQHGCRVAVIKSLDHWPDLGSDLDLFTLADPAALSRVMSEQLRAEPVERSWGDRLAQKWNYRVPGLSELVEVHVQFLGQTGEHAEIGRRVIERRIVKSVEGHDFYAAAPEEQIVISALQRVYRHFYFRLCDMIDNAELIRSGAVDFIELERAANSAGIWSGVATFLCLIQNYIEAYGGSLALPEEVFEAAPDRYSNVRFGAGFLRVSKVTGARLYGSQLLHAGLRRDTRALLRLPLLPPLAVSAFLAYSITGNDKGIW